jgi:hypothetical protein
VAGAVGLVVVIVAGAVGLVVVIVAGAVGLVVVIEPPHGRLGRAREPAGRLVTGYRVLAVNEGVRLGRGQRLRAGSGTFAGPHRGRQVHRHQLVRRRVHLLRDGLRGLRVRAGAG